jgi:quinohemoprotein ethanol dehydrogenase
MSFSPQTKLVYIPSQDTPFAYIDDPAFQPHPLGFNIGISGAAASLPQDPKVKAQVIASVRGFLKAWDPIAQKEVWHVEQPGAWNGGVLSTAGSLVFEGNASGQFNAYNATNGANVWSFAAQGGIIAAPISFAVAGEQYVAVVVGWGGTYPLSVGEPSQKGGLTTNQSRILAFRLGGKASLPTPPTPAAKPTPPERFGDQATITQGFMLFHSYCSVCHGDAAVGGGVLPDLRFVGSLQNAASWKSVVIDGALTKAGMVSFGRVFDAPGAESIRAYVTGRAHDALEPPPAAAAAPAANAPTPAPDTKAATQSGKPTKSSKPPAAHP